MRPRDVVLALAVTVCWGVNFVLIDLGLREFPPFFLATLRFLFTAIPAVFIVRRPDVPWRTLVLVGLCYGVGQFGLLFLSLRLGMPAGLASIVVQSQAIFTLLFGAALLRERPPRRVLVGTLIAAAGLIVIGAGSYGDVPAVAFLLTIASAACWGAGNIVTRRTGVAGFALLAWASLTASPLLFGVSLVFDGPAAIWHSVTNPELVPIVATALMVLLASVFGFGVWTSLLRIYPADLVAPISLLVPVTGLATAWVVLGERPTLVELLGSVIVVGGVGLLYVRVSASRVA